MKLKTSDQAEMELGFGGYRCNWGCHMCGLYQTEAERDAIIAGFLQKGLAEGDLGIFCPFEQTPEEFGQTFEGLFPGKSARLRDASVFRFLKAKELYYPNGTFSPKAMDEGLGAFFEESQAAGPRNVRATAEMAWALEKIPGVKDLMAYESRLNLFIAGKPWISVCMYNTAKFSGDMIMKVLQTHPFAISGGAVTENPFYIDARQWLASNAPEYNY
jgi:hypothetical protein